MFRRRWSIRPSAMSMDQGGRHEPRFDLGRQQPHEQVQEERDEDEIVDYAREGKSEVDRIQGIEPKNDRDRPQPDRPAPVSQGEPEQTQVVRHQSPEPEQSNHGGSSRMRMSL